MRLFVVGLSLAVACNGSNPGASPDASVDGPVSPDAAAALSPVTFTYAPDWDGVQTIDVIGGFGSSSDWTAPFVSLTEGSGGVWTGTGMVAPGTYPYLFVVVGDDAAGSGSGSAYSRYSLDGTVSEFEPCPAGPTIADNPANPCSLVTVPQGAAETLYTIHGSVVLGGSAAARYLVMLERDEGSASHHYFVNRRATGSDGNYTFDVAAGSYRVQVLHASYLAKKDAQIDPQKADTIRRDVSAAFAVGSDLVVSAADVTPPDYSAFEPSGSATLPTTFTFPAVGGTTLDVYGSGKEIGDPLFQSPATGSGSASFDGTFDDQTTVNPAYTYRWGIEYPGGAVLEVGSGAGSAGVKWRAQSLTYPIAWPE